MVDMKKYLAQHHKQFGLAGALLALCVAAIYLVVVPAEAAEATGIQQAILKYGHSLCWVMLAAASFASGVKGGNKLSGRFLYVALGVYIMFIISLLV